MSLLSLTLILFLIIDPVGKISPLLSITQASRHPSRMIAREMLIALGVMILFNLIGEALFGLLNINATTVQFSSGAILFITAIKILFPPTKPVSYSFPPGEPFIVPIAIPLVAGPALVATIMLFSQMSENSAFEMMSAIIIAWALSSAIFLAAKPLKQLIGNSGLIACERLMAMLLVMLAIQRFMDGVISFYATT